MSIFGLYNFSHFCKLCENMYCVTFSGIYYIYCRVLQKVYHFMEGVYVFFWHELFHYFMKICIELAHC